MTQCPNYEPFKAAIAVLSVLVHMTLPTKVKNIKTKVKFLARFPNFSLQKEMCTYDTRLVFSNVSQHIRGVLRAARTKS